MKKLITLLIASGAFAALHAQTSKDEARRVVLGQNKKTSAPSGQGRDVILGRGNGNNYPYPNTNPNNYPVGSRQARIDQVNREYDAKIWSIRNNNSLTPAEKERMIRQLEQDRARRIREINQSGGYGDRDEGKGKGYGKNNNPGRHLGWEKGKGNPHKYGGQPGRGNGKHDKDDDNNDD